MVLFTIQKVTAYERSQPESVGSDTGVRHLGAAVWRYVDRQLPLPQIGALFVVVATSFALYGRITGTTSWELQLVVVALTVALLFLHMRLAEDVDIHYCGGELIGNLGPRRPLAGAHPGRVVLGNGRVVPRLSVLRLALAL